MEPVVFAHGPFCCICYLELILLDIITELLTFLHKGHSPEVFSPYICARIVIQTKSLTRLTDLRLFF